MLQLSPGASSSILTSNPIGSLVANPKTSLRECPFAQAGLTRTKESGHPARAVEAWNLLPGSKISLCGKPTSLCNKALNACHASCGREILRRAATSCSRTAWVPGQARHDMHGEVFTLARHA